jgi:hypothetical protein
MARRRKEEGRVGRASRSMGRRWGHVFSRVRHRGVRDREKVPERCSGLHARRMAVLSTLRTPSLVAPCTVHYCAAWCSM